jgi:hypothetical protein
MFEGIKMKTKTSTLFATVTFFATLGITVQTFAQNTQSIGASQTAQIAQAKILDQYDKLPLSFEANRGQTDSKVKFLSRGHGYSLFLTGDEAVFALKKTARESDKMKEMAGRRRIEPQKENAMEGTVIRMRLAHANVRPQVVGAEELPGRTNYFIGNEPAKWRTNVPTFAKVKYEGIYPGVDLVYYGNQGQLEYDFVVAPGADPHEIRLRFRGAGKLQLDEKGDLRLGSTGEEVRLAKPVVYQEVSGDKKLVDGNYVLASASLIGFRLGEYDHSKALIIDPVVIYSTYLGGSETDYSYGIAVDAAGNAYVTGQTFSVNFPTVNALQSTDGQPPLYNPWDAFVSKFNPSGSALIYSTYLGGSGGDDVHPGSAGMAIAVDTYGNAYVTGSARIGNFPTTVGALQPDCGGAVGGNAFVSELNASGSALVYSTCLGGSGTTGGDEFIGDEGFGIALDTSGNAYVTGLAVSPDFPTVNALQSTLGSPNGNAFVSKINASGSALVYSTYLGGTGIDGDEGFGIAADASGNAYVTGYATSTNFPTANALQPSLAGSSNAFVTVINASGSGLLYSTYLGGSDGDAGYGIAVDISGNAYVTGSASSPDFPITTGAFQTTCCGGFVSKINASGSTLVYSTYLGASGEAGIAVDASGNAYVAGDDAVVSEINASGSALIYSTSFGGSSNGQGIAVDAFGNTYVTGYTASNNFPTVNALQPTLAGVINAFVAKIAPTPVTSANLSPGPNSYGWNNTSVTVYLNATENPGSGVEQIQFSLSGAENHGMQTVAGNTASVTISAQGITTLTYFATDNVGNVEVAQSLTIQIDETSPVVTATGLTNGALYYFKQAPAAGCSTTDALSGVATQASLAVAGGNKFGYGAYTATCSGAIDEAGNIAAPISVSYKVNGPTDLAGLVGLKAGPLKARVWQIIIGNSGPGGAYNTAVTNLSLRQISGAACTPLLESTLPINVGHIGPLNLATISVRIDFAGCASNARFTLNGQVSANDATAVGPIVMLNDVP